MLGTAMYIGVINRWILILIPVLGVFMYFFVRYFSSFCVPVKRLEASTRSPIFSHLTSTIQGLSVIRCHGFEAQFAARMDQLLDAHGKIVHVNHVTRMLAQHARLLFDCVLPYYCVVSLNLLSRCVDPRCCCPQYRVCHGSDCLHAAFCHQGRPPSLLKCKYSDSHTLCSLSTCNAK